MNSLVISFGPDGTARSLWTDRLPLAALGTLEIERASTIEFNGAEQVWEVRMGNSISAPVAFRNASRQSCIDWEIQTVQGSL
jgi:hypothetical protein